MRPGARTPEELETLLEDALLLGDGPALAGLFEECAVLTTGGETREARGGEEIARLATTIGYCIYLAAPRRVLQATDTALVLAERAINVARRGHDGAWRYAISFLSNNTPIRREDT